MSVIRALLATMTGLAIGAAGCGYDGPGAMGTITLGPDVDATAFQSLFLRAFPPESESFDPLQPFPRNAVARSVLLSRLRFPYGYSLGAGTGHSDVPTWLFVAWISRRGTDEVSDSLAPGDVYCTVPFDVFCQGSEEGGGDYCDLTSGVDCILATVVPPAG